MEISGMIYTAAFVFYEDICSLPAGEELLCVRKGSNMMDLHTVAYARVQWHLFIHLFVIV